jgi:urease accessory protein
MTSKLRTSLATLFLLSIPSIVSAHASVGDAGGFAPSGFVHGFAHPVSGLDHILAMVMTGVFAYRPGGKAFWVLPLTFLLLMAVGGGLGAANVSLPLAETGIAVSVVTLGAIVALGLNIAMAMAMGIVGVFSIFHGYAHGVEMPREAGFASYMAGFVSASGLLQAVGAGISFVVATRWKAGSLMFARSAGGLVATAGLAFLTGVF